MISEEGDKILKHNLGILYRMREQKKITDDQFHKGVVCLAYEYMVNDSPASAMALLAMVPEVYFKIVQPLQLSEDAAYWEVAAGLAKMLVAKGYAGLESDDCQPTQAPATKLLN